MRYFIGIEDLAANALIVILGQNENNRFIPYSKMNEYGLIVIKMLEEGGDNGIFIFSRDNVSTCLNDYSDYFEESETEGQQGISLRDGIKLDDLITKFLACLPLKLFDAFLKANDMFKKQID